MKTYVHYVGKWWVKGNMWWWVLCDGRCASIMLWRVCRQRGDVCVCAQVFGAFLSCPPKVSDGFYGTGESLLFTFHPEFKVRKWVEHLNCLAGIKTWLFCSTVLLLLDIITCRIIRNFYRHISISSCKCMHVYDTFSSSCVVRHSPGPELTTFLLKAITRVCSLARESKYFGCT